MATFLLWRGRVDLRADDVAARRGQRFNLVRAAVSQKVAMEITGHLTPSVFERYNITDDRPREAVKRLAAAAQFGPKGVPSREPRLRIYRCYGLAT